MSQPDLAQATNRIMERENKSGIPLPYRRSFDRVLDETELTKKLVLQHLARVAGRARGAGDDFSRLIFNIVRERPNVKVVQLLGILDGPRGEELEIRIETGTEALAGRRLIHYSLEDGRQRSVSISALANRLRRAKKKLAN